MRKRAAVPPPQPSAPPPRRDRRPDLALAGTLLLALALRLWGIGWGLPSATHYFSYHPDESVVLETAMGMNVFAGRLLPHFYNYGSLQLYLVNLANTLYVLFGGGTFAIRALSIDYPTWARMYLIGRLLSVGMGVGTVWATYVIGRRLWGVRAGLLAALTLALMPLHAQHSHFLTVDAPATFWGVLSLLWAVRLATDDPKPLRAAIWAGVFAGLATATKYNMALAILPFLAACVVARQPKALALGLPAFVLAFFLACPGALLETDTFLAGVRFEAVHVQNVDDPTFKDTGSGFVYHIAHNLNAGLGLPLLLLALGSVGYAVYRRGRGDGLLAAFALPYYVLISLAAVRYARYTIPLLPFLALWTGRMAADSLQMMAVQKADERRAAADGPQRSRQSSPYRKTIRLVASTALGLLLTLFTAVDLLTPMTKPDVRDRALQYLNTAGVSPNGSPAAVGFAAQPWFGTPPVSPYFSNPRPGGWRDGTPPDVLRRIVYSGKDWDVDLLEARKPTFLVLSEFDYRDALRLGDPDALRYLQAVRREYGPPMIFSDVNRTSPPHQMLDGLPVRGLPHDMLYPNPYILIFQRKGAP